MKNIKHLNALFSKVKWLNSTADSIVAEIQEGVAIDSAYTVPQSGIWGLVPKPRNPETYMRIFLGKDEKEAKAFLEDHWNSQELANIYGNGTAEGLVITGFVS